MPESEAHRESKLEAVVPFGNEENVVFETTTAALKDDLVTEATAQGVSSEDAQALANQIRWHTEIPAEIPDEYSDNLGLVEKDSEGKPKICVLEIGNIANVVYRKFNSHPKEVRKAALNQAIHSMWRHERQHIIQSAKPLDKERSREVRGKHLRRAQVISQITLVAAGSSMAFSYINGSLEASGAALAIGCIGGYLSLKEAIDKSYYNDPVEVEARKHSKSDSNPNRRSPFKINIEKTSQY